MAKKSKTDGMSRKLKLAYFSTGRVTVGTITQVFDNDLKKFYVAKIRGVIVGNEGEYKHETPEAAKAYGKEVQDGWRAEFTAFQQGVQADGACAMCGGEDLHNEGCAYEGFVAKPAGYANRRKAEPESVTGTDSVVRSAGF